MHEVGLIESVVAMAVEAAGREGAAKIHRVTLRIGRLAGVEPEALALAFEVVSEGTIAEGATLEVETVEVVCHCAGCGLNFTPTDLVFLCPACEQPCADVRQGREMELAFLEVS
jgi:hydrogenase nickel incorporation protein HypA/HybF